MASGSSAEQPQAGLARTFYCHQCHTRTYPTTEHIDVVQPEIMSSLINHLMMFLFQNFTCMRCGSGFVEDVTIREDSPSSNSDDQSFGDIDPGIGDAFEVIF